jgi:hypothetical protein
VAVLALCGRARLGVLALVTVWVDPAGRSRQPIPVGRAGVVLTSAGASTRLLRLFAHFWRHRPDQSSQALLALVEGEGGAPLEVTGVILYPGAPPPVPRGFRLQISPSARAAAVTHTLGADTECAHTADLAGGADAGGPFGPAADEMGGSLFELLAPLLGRRRSCPALKGTNGDRATCGR